jgi:hypothetical protein
MNIVEPEVLLTIVAKTCGCTERDNKRKIAYALIDSYHSLCLDKKDIIRSELMACEKLLKYTTEEQGDRPIVEKEMAELKMTLDLLPRNYSRYPAAVHQKRNGI